MPWREAYALHIFAPSEPPYNEDNWVEQIFGTTVKPINDIFGDHIKWLWVTRYSGLYNEESPPVNCILPGRYRINGYYRFIVFRLCVDNEIRSQLHDNTILLAEEANCFTYPDGWIEYDIVEDLGSNRFIRDNSDREDRNHRALLVARFIDSTVRLMLDSLISFDGETWRQESNTLTQQNPSGSFFESVHHLFCNATFTPTTILVARRGNHISFRTHWMPQYPSIDLDSSGDFDWQEVPIHY